MRGYRAHVALTLFAAAIAASGGSAPGWAQTATSPYIEPNPNVTVDLSVLDGYGGTPNVADMLRPGYQGGGASGGYAPPAGYAGAPATGASAGIPAFLVRPDAPRYAAPPPEVQALLHGQRSGAAQVRPSAAPSGAAPMLRAPATAPARSAPPARTQAAPKPKPAAPASSQTAAAPPPPPPVPSTGTASRTNPTPPPPPPSVPPATKTAAVAPPPPPAVPKQQPATTVAATSAPAPAPAPQPSSQGGGDTVRIAFPAGQSQLPSDAKGQLDRVISQLQQNDGLRVQLMAYADGDQDGANKARRLSLSRALAVRAYLIDNEVASTRMDVRALGNRSDDGPADRVDLVVIDR